MADLLPLDTFYLLNEKEADTKLIAHTILPIKNNNNNNSTY